MKPSQRRKSPETSPTDGATIAAAERDVTGRKKIEETLRQSVRRERERAAELAILFDSVPTPVFIAHDPDCLHISGNRAADELLRIPRGAEASLSAPTSVKPRQFRAFKDGRELRPDELPAQQAARGVSVQDFEFSLVFDDGTIRHVVGYGTPLRDEQGHPRGAVHVLVDITERKKAEDELRRSAEELKAANAELSRFNEAAVGRELRMIELKKQVNDLCEKAGLPPRYRMAVEERP